MSVRSLRAAVRRSPVLAGAAILSAGLVLTGCGDDVVDDGVEQEVEEGGEEVEEGVEEGGEEVEEEVDEETTD